MSRRRQEETFFTLPKTIRGWIVFVSMCELGLWALTMLTPYGMIGIVLAAVAVFGVLLNPLVRCEQARPMINYA